MTNGFLDRNVLPGHMDTYTATLVVTTAICWDQHKDLDLYMGSTLEELEHVVDDRYPEDTCLNMSGEKPMSVRLRD